MVIVSVGLLNSPSLWFGDATLNLMLGVPSVSEFILSTSSPTAKDPSFISIGRYLGIANWVKSVFSMNTKYLVFGFTLFAVTSIFLDLTL